MHSLEPVKGHVHLWMGYLCGKASCHRMKVLILSAAIPPWTRQISSEGAYTNGHGEIDSLVLWRANTIFKWSFWHYCVKWCIYVKSWNFKIKNLQDWGFLILLYLYAEFVFVIWDCSNSKPPPAEFITYLADLSLFLMV